MRPFLLGWATLLLLGCSGGEKTYKKLAELQKPRIFFISEYGPPKLQLYTDFGDDCPSFEGTGWMNGKRLDLVEPGGWQSELIGIPFPRPTAVCKYPEWRLPMPLPAEGVTQFVIKDETGTLSMGLHNVGARRGVRYRAPTTSNLRWGQLAELDLIPSTDHVNRETRGELKLSNGDYTPSLFSYGSFDPERLQEGILSFHLPEQPREGMPPVIRDAKLIVSLGQIYLKKEYCEPDPEQCWAWIWLSVADTPELPISIE